jgi:hypothetical protein
VHDQHMVHGHKGPHNLESPAVKQLTALKSMPVKLFEFMYLVLFHNSKLCDA